MEAKSPRGTTDILPGEVELWQRVERTVAEVMRLFDYHEVRTPVFEHTELFQRGVGETTDIVEKQMYSFADRGGRDLTLRPEGTAPVVRAYLQHRLSGRGLPQRLWYIQPMFRYERPQAGRARQFHQFGAEAIGSSDPACDVEMITIPLEVYRRLGIRDHSVLLNSIGCPECRPAYRDALRQFLAGKLDQLCRTCVGRYERNPLRILDCKVEGCRQAIEGAPAAVDYLCDECRTHFAGVTGLLDRLGVPYTLDNRLVRGLDYYTKTVFEIVTGALGAQDALAAGGRYDGLTEEIGGPKTPAVGFGAGLERAVLALKAQKAEEIQAEPVEVFVVSLGADARPEALKIVNDLRRVGLACTFDYVDTGQKLRSMRGQMKAAGKSQCNYTLIIGEEELARGVVTLKVMADGSQREVPIAQVTEELEEAGGAGGNTGR